MKYFIAVILILFCASLLAQQKDTTAVKNIRQSNIAIPDSVSKAKADSTKTKKKYDVDAIVYSSSADSLIFDVVKKKMFVYGNGELKYKDTDLKSAKIFVDYTTNELEAFGRADTSDTAKVKLKETPRLLEGQDNYEGTSLKYNFKNQRGFISMAKNKEQGKRYEGEKVKKVDKTTFFIEHGMFTTCEKDTPDTYFTASEMKVIQKSQIVARWIFMYVGGVPIPIPLPFAVFPNESGRRSGLIIPTYGQDNNRGQYFKNFGYFWAINDYMDATLTGDYYTKGGYGLHNRFRYAQRYNFSGSFNASYSHIILGEPSDPGREEQQDWNLSWSHNQQINPSTRLDVNLQFVSSKFFQNNGVSYNDLLNQNIVSNATFSKSWDESGTSLSINYSRTQNLSTGNVTESLPNVYFTKSITYPFQSDNLESTRNQKWYEMVGYSYSGQFSNNRVKTDSTLDINMGVQHNVAISASPKIGYFNISPNFNYTERWYNKRLKYEVKQYEFINSSGVKSTRDTVLSSMVDEFGALRTFTASLTASTKLYGIFNPNLFGVESFRHTLLPSISYSYTPDFSNDSWGNYDSYTLSNGTKVRYDKFANGIFGSTPSGLTQSLNFSLGNVFEMKMAKSESDTTNEQKKITLLNLNAGIGYNFAADSMKLGTLGLNYRTQIGNNLNLSGSSTYLFYDQVPNSSGGYSTVNQFLVSKGKGLFRLTDFSFSISTSLRGESTKAKDSKKQEQTKNPEEEYSAFNKKDYISTYDDNSNPDFSIPWNLNLSYNYNYSKPTPVESNSYSSLTADLGFSLTKNWKFTIRGGYDFTTKLVTAPQITINRDLHCWQMNFSWNPIGYYSGFHFEIRMKSSEFQDVKVTKSEGLYSGRR
jgi:lipopolysaccharide assembly outer membrane protein LptD (OstA)